jgi:DNA-binding NtrC family response regulator
VETARDGHEAVALMRQTPYSAALVDIRLPDLDGYQIFHRLREIQPQTPVILMTGFGYDPTHSIVKARQEGLQTVLYKPFRSDRLMEAVEQALRIAASPSSTHGSNSEDGTHKTSALCAAPVSSAATAHAGERGQSSSAPTPDGASNLDGESRPTEVLRHEP